MRHAGIARRVGQVRYLQNMESWECVARREDVTEQRPFSSDSGDNGIGVYELDGEICALEDTCPHGPSLLSRGQIINGRVKCPLHGAEFDIKTGKCLLGPAERDLEVYPVRIEGNDVYVQIVTE